MTEPDDPEIRPTTRDVAERIRRVVASLAERFERATDDDDESSTVLSDAAARSLGGMIERLRSNAGTRLFVGAVGRDLLVGAGERVVLSASVGPATTLASSVRFYFGGELGAETAVRGSDEVRVAVRAPGPGLHSIEAKACDSRGQVVSELAGQGVLQVASGRPVVLVDADLFLDVGSRAGRAAAADDELLEALAALQNAGLELAYFDVDEKSRDAEIHDEIRARGFPPGAALVYSAERAEFRSLGVDFVDMFASTAVRRLRARGVPVTTVLTDHVADSELARVEGVDVLGPERAIERARSDAFAAEFDQAARFEAARAESRSPLDWSLDQTTASRLVAGNSFRAELDNGAARRCVFAALGSARATIHLQFYMVRPSLFTEELTVLLIRRARAGVRVRILVDALYSDDEVFGRANPSVLSLRAEPNIEVRSVDPIAISESVDVSRLKVRDHRKLAIIDGRRAFVSGRNAGDEYFRGFDEVPVHDNTRHENIPWLDAHVEVSGPLVREVQQAFLLTWAEQGGGPVDRDDGVLPRLEATGTAAGRLVVHRGLSETNCLAMYLAMLEHAEHHVYIVNDFPFVASIEQAIHALLADGVDVRLLTGTATARRDDGSFFPAPLHRTLFEFMVKARLEPLIEAGVRAFEFVPRPSETVVSRGGRIRPYVHAKIVSIDGLVTSIGSANLDATASYWESEANIVVQDAAFASGVEEELQSLIDASDELDLDSRYWRRESAQRALVSTLWPRALYS